MPDQRGHNQGIRVLEEYVCQAIADPSQARPETEPGSAGRGANHGVRLLPEVVLVPGPPESPEVARERKERLPRLLICAPRLCSRVVELDERCR